MSQKDLEPLQTSRLSLSARISIGLVLAALIPLVLITIFSQVQTRPALVNRANAGMENDAQTRVQLIDTYLNERLLDIKTLTQVESLQTFLATPPPPETPLNVYQNLEQHALFGLGAGLFRDKNYTKWVLFDTQKKPVLFYPLPNPPQMYGKYSIPPEDLAMLGKGQFFFSEVHYMPDSKSATIDLYGPVVTPQKQTVGFMRSTLKLDYIWNIVNGDQGSNGSGSYAFILDENGIRIADTAAARRFTSVAPLPPDLQQTISQEQRFGTADTVSVLQDNAATSALHNLSPLVDFQAQPAGQQEQFQVVRRTTATVPWHYFVLSPVNTVTSVANRQMISTAAVAFAVLVFVIAIGILLGQGITRPVLRAVKSLRSSSHALSNLASKQQDAASEQMWVVDSSQVGLQSVLYYTDATAVAAKQLSKVGLDLVQRAEVIDAYEATQALGRIVQAAQYIENAAQYQNSSTEKLATALRVATQVTEQLVEGTTSATEAANQLEKVVMQLRDVVGK